MTQERWDAHPDVRTGSDLTVQERVANAITRFSGSMRFLYLHAVLFVLWLTVFEKSPWQVLTLIVSLEAIFLSTFVMISQNQAERISSELAMSNYKSSIEDQETGAESLRLIKKLCESIGVDTSVDEED